MAGMADDSDAEPPPLDGHGGRGSHSHTGLLMEGFAGGPCAGDADVLAFGRPTLAEQADAFYAEWEQSQVSPDAAEMAPATQRAPGTSVTSRSRQRRAELSSRILREERPARPSTGWVAARVILLLMLKKKTGGAAQVLGAAASQLKDAFGVHIDTSRIRPMATSEKLLRDSIEMASPAEKSALLSHAVAYMRVRRNHPAAPDPVFLEIDRAVAERTGGVLQEHAAVPPFPQGTRARTKRCAIVAALLASRATEFSLGEKSVRVLAYSRTDLENRTSAKVGVTSSHLRDIMGDVQDMPPFMVLTPDERRLLQAFQGDIGDVRAQIFAHAQLYLSAQMDARR